MLNIIFSLIKDFFKPQDEYGTGALRNPEDYRDIQLGSIQKPVGAPDTYINITLLDLPKLNQRKIGACVPHSVAKIFMWYVFKKTGKIIDFSPRFDYRLCKMLDGYEGSGTYARMGGLVFNKFGCTTEKMVVNNTTLSEKEYLNFPVTKEILEDAQSKKIPGFAFEDINLESLKEAIFQNGVITLCGIVGNWHSLPLRPRINGGGHQFVVYGYEKLSNGDYKFFVDNSWGESWVKSFKGETPYFLWSEYKDHLYDAMVYIDIPKDFLNQTKALPFKFTKTLEVGMVDKEVFELQKLLNHNPETMISLDGPGSSGQETSYFGLATQDALKRWQTKYKISPVGIFGPQSRAKANERIPKISLVGALITVESGGDDNAIGDKHLTHKAYGCLQIRQPYMDDVNKSWRTNYKAQQCLGDRAFSIKVFESYMRLYEDGSTNEDKAKCHNGGAGWRKRYYSGLTKDKQFRNNLDAYWGKVKKVLDRQ
jgi:peptidoglycan hydrolase-like protein with peptidoglycan-binding domain